MNIHGIHSWRYHPFMGLELCTYTEPYPSSAPSLTPSESTVLYVVASPLTFCDALALVLQSS